MAQPNSVEPADHLDSVSKEPGITPGSVGLENMRHYRCPTCGRLTSDSQPFVDEIWCTHRNGRFVYRAPWDPAIDWTLMDPIDLDGLQHRLEAAEEVNRSLRQRLERAKELDRDQRARLSAALRDFPSCASPEAAERIVGIVEGVLRPS